MAVKHAPIQYVMTSGDAGRPALTVTRGDRNKVKVKVKTLHSNQKITGYYGSILWVIDPLQTPIPVKVLNHTAGP